MKIETIDAGIRVALEFGYKNPSVNTYCATLTKGRGGSHQIVRIEDKEQEFEIFFDDYFVDTEKKGEITFNGVSFDEWKEEVS
jgi:hypothetical protein